MEEWLAWCERLVERMLKHGLEEMVNPYDGPISYVTYPGKAATRIENINKQISIRILSPMVLNLGISDEHLKLHALLPNAT